MERGEGDVKRSPELIELGATKLVLPKLGNRKEGAEGIEADSSEVFACHVVGEAGQLRRIGWGAHKW